jgi:hypothetical protein
MGPKSLMGSALKAGYQSHFVLTVPLGNVYDQEMDAHQKMCNGTLFFLFFFVYLYLVFVNLVFPPSFFDAICYATL